jgi:hypothetical protein
MMRLPTWAHVTRDAAAHDSAQKSTDFADCLAAEFLQPVETG